ncbi:MAG: ribonuclease P protein component [Candidatus Syntrophosphaera sp.]
MLRLITEHREYGEFSSPDFFTRSRHFHAAVLFSASEFALGITISRKVGKAHVRNLLKRRIKAWLRENQEELPQCFKVNLIARHGSGELNWQELCSELNTLIRQLRERA